MNVFTEFRRGKTIENQGIRESYTPPAATCGAICRRRRRVISSETRSFTTRPVRVSTTWFVSQSQSLPTRTQNRTAVHLTLHEVYGVSLQIH